MDDLTAETTLSSAVPPIGPDDTSQSVVSVMLEYLDSEEFYWPGITKHITVEKDLDPHL